MWRVTECTKCRSNSYWYGDIDDDFQCDCCGSDGFVEKANDSFSSDNIAMIIENELEDGNYHAWTWLPETLNKLIKKHEISDSQRVIIMRELSDELWKNI